MRRQFSHISYALNEYTILPGYHTSKPKNLEPSSLVQLRRHKKPSGTSFPGLLHCVHQYDHRQSKLPSNPTEKYNAQTTRPQLTPAYPPARSTHQLTQFRKKPRHRTLSLHESRQTHAQPVIPRVTPPTIPKPGTSEHPTYPSGRHYCNSKILPGG
ncbi:hypothetical protein BO82DRAFT_353897 [Aspergillus uvarum CBS 121591]|uniref:Uncharacterized protein n=1 Tax=Aspergillus uvarum CBS 121591 TaxID=1448315 RepID=A0A319CGB1_9EURO|nr:hypothetical protein BO82DRAFT_353897 [Aspergillus uvarum CBS 121591]PYH82347.1 hypothetical protein BO82DRAFT_353897 [Aspergillus uvarum CBS 121591]